MFPLWILIDRAQYGEWDHKKVETKKMLVKGRDNGMNLILHDGRPEMTCGDSPCTVPPTARLGRMQALKINLVWRLASWCRCSYATHTDGQLKLKSISHNCSDVDLHSAPRATPFGIVRAFCRHSYFISS